jgi:membrane-associated PAP2 superfamily phosphatase
MSRNKQIFITGVILIATIIFFGLSPLDGQMQDRLFDVASGTWMVDKQLEPYKFIFYTGLKKAIILVGVAILFFYLYAKFSGKFKSYHKGLLIVVISSVLVPAVVGGLKKTTNMPCPHAEMRYGGEVIEHVPVWERYTDANRPADHKECWPAGHASGGFALLSLFFLFHKRSNRWIALGGALVVGWTMGIYKMMVGDHFFSHTMITMVLAWLLVLVSAKLVDTLVCEPQEK